RTNENAVLGTTRVVEDPNRSARREMLLQLGLGGGPVRFGIVLRDRGACPNVRTEPDAVVAIGATTDRVPVGDIFREVRSLRVGNADEMRLGDLTVDGRPAARANREG